VGAEKEELKKCIDTVRKAHATPKLKRHPWKASQNGNSTFQGPASEDSR